MTDPYNINEPFFDPLTQVDAKASFASCNFCGFAVPVALPDEISPDWMHFGCCPKCRDEFARAALTGILANPQSMSDIRMQAGEEPGVPLRMMDIFASSSYSIADAMLKARKPNQTSINDLTG